MMMCNLVRNAWISPIARRLAACLPPPPLPPQLTDPPPLLRACVTQASALPFRSTTFTAEVDGRPTEFALTGYSDRVLVVASQLGSLGSILAAEKETVLGGGSTYRVDTLLGEALRA